MIAQHWLVGLAMIIPWSVLPYVSTAVAQTEETTADRRADGELVLNQGRIADQYVRLEELLRKLRDFEQTQNPRRAKLLEQAFRQSKDKFTAKQLETVVRQLSRKQWSLALKGQAVVKTDLEALLELLKSEDRGERIKSAQTRIQEYIKEIERILRIQKGARGQTENGGEMQKLSQAQGRIAERTGELDQQIKLDEGTADPDSKQNESDPNAPNQEPSGENNQGQEGPDQGKQGQPGQQKPAQQKPAQGKQDAKPPQDREGQPKGQPSGQQGDPKPQDDQDNADRQQRPPKQDPQQKPGDPDNEREPQDRGDDQQNKQDESQDSPEGKAGEGQQSSGQPQGAQPSQQQGSQNESPQNQQPSNQQNDGSQQQQQGNSQQQDNPPTPQENPVRKRIQAAEERMQQAQRRLQEAQRKESIEEQRKAEEFLKQAKKELEEILRQLREEEVERVLALLEGRFRKMLERQLRVYEETKKIDKIPLAQRSSEVDIQSGKLSAEQHQIAVDADKALILLQEEGSSVAFPVTVEQMRDDMDQVSYRLARTKVGKITQGIEEDIIDTLEYIIQALVQAQQDMEQQQQQPNQPPPQQGQPQDQPLVDALAELKLIRGLQERVHKRHVRYSELLADPDDLVGQADDPDLQAALQRLAERQAKIVRITRDLVLGKNE